jgi:hypothetical protein
MRPWTMVVLTDYGRDRLAYQAYDQLFDPELPARQLPLSNRYVQRMQLVYALLDELGDMTHADPLKIQVWRDMKGPADDSQIKQWDEPSRRALERLVRKVSVEELASASQGLLSEARALAPQDRGREMQWSGYNWLKTRLAHRRLHAVLKRFLSSEDAGYRLATSLQKRLAISREDMDVLLWNQPRPLLLGAVPTAMRRLALDWRGKDGEHSDYRAGHPLPDYVPANLFDDLSLPEMHLALPGSESEGHYLPVQQGLGEFAPGKVSRRFDDALWLGVSSQTLNTYLGMGHAILEQDADIGEWYETQSERPFHRLEDGQVVTYRAYRPTTARLQAAPGRATQVEFASGSAARRHRVSPPRKCRRRPPHSVNRCAYACGSIHRRGAPVRDRIARGHAHAYWQ